MLFLAVCAYGVEHLVALVLLDAVVAHLVDNRLAVGRSSSAADASHSPKRLGIHAVAVGDSRNVGSLANHSLSL